MTKFFQNEQRRVLVVDDDPDCLEIVTKALHWEGYNVESANSGIEALKKIASWFPHLVILDMNMPKLNGIQTLKKIRQKQESYVSVIFLSGNTATEDKIRGLNAGADDYICKPFEPLELLARVRSQLRIKDLNDDLIAANKKLRELVDIDDLTGLFNMRSLYRRLDFELERARRFKRCISAAMMDMDFFKNVNDGHDHLFGSFVLTQVGEIIKENIRTIDFAARYGGDEFLIILTEVNQMGANLFCERLRSRIEAFNFEHEEDSIRLTASIGYALFNPKFDKPEARSLVRNADRALYQAKELGRNRVIEYTDKMIDAIDERKLAARRAQKE